jgi:hypothetical protein
LEPGKEGFLWFKKTTPKNTAVIFGYVEIANFNDFLFFEKNWKSFVTEAAGSCDSNSFLDKLLNHTDILSLPSHMWTSTRDRKVVEEEEEEGDNNSTSISNNSSTNSSSNSSSSPASTNIDPVLLKINLLVCRIREEDPPCT